MDIPLPLWLLENYLVLQGCSLVYWLDRKTKEASIAVGLYWFWAAYLILSNTSSYRYEISVAGLLVLVWLLDQWIYRHPPAWLLKLKPTSKKVSSPSSTEQPTNTNSS